MKKISIRIIYETGWKKIRRTLNEILLGFLFIAAVAIFNFMTLIPPHVYVWVGIVGITWFLFWVILKWHQFKRQPESYLNAEGYVVLTRENELEHRHIAKKILGRDLSRSEVVHHVNGNKTANQAHNLCVMDLEKHEHFHAWLRWKREKNRRYPTLSHQKRVLVDEYGGTLLEDLKPVKQEIWKNQREKGEKRNFSDKPKSYVIRRNQVTKRMFVEFDKEVLISPDGKEVEIDLERFGEAEEVAETELTEKQIRICESKARSRDSGFSDLNGTSEVQRRLFLELRKERKKLAKERGVPPYIVFDDKTLREMADIMPVSESLMLQIKGIGPEKFRLYGAQFINVVKKFKRVG